ncbi:hypothetical protein PINS_up004311 [Pythium insidiosum]|nr:hypothetical protein PINS_up004311 [Pythium insidiosum]
MAKYERTLDEHDLNALPVLDEFVDQHVIYWLGYIVSRFADATVLIVGMKADVKDNAMLQASVAKDLEARLELWKIALEDEMEDSRDASESASPSATATATGRMVVSVYERLEQQRTWLNDKNHRKWITVGRQSSRADLRATVRDVIKKKNLVHKFTTPSVSDLASFRPTLERVIGLKQRSELPSVEPLFDLGEFIALPTIAEDGACHVIDARTLAKLVSELLQSIAPREQQTNDDDDVDERQTEDWLCKQVGELCGNTEENNVPLPPGLVTQAELMKLEHWKRIKEKEMLSSVKEFMVNHRFVYIQNGTNDSGDAVENLIIPTWWRLDEERQPNLSAHHAPLVELIKLRPDISTNLHKASWEYEFNTIFLPQTLFEHAAIGCYVHNLRLKVLEKDVLGWSNDQSVFRIAVYYHRGGPPRHKIRVEVVAVTQALCAALLKWCCKVVELSIDKHPGLLPERYEIDEENGEAKKIYEHPSNRADEERLRWFFTKEWKDHPDMVEDYPSLEKQKNLGTPSPVTLHVRAVSNSGFKSYTWKNKCLEWELVSSSNSTKKKKMSYRRATVAIEHDGGPQWSTHRIYLTPAPAIRNLRDWNLQLTVRSNTFPRLFGYIARGIQPLSALNISDDFSTFTSTRVEIALKNRWNTEIGRLRCIISHDLKQ